MLIRESAEVLKTTTNMPPKRKKADQAKAQLSNGSSSSESDYSRTLEIVTKITQKYLGNKKYPGGQTDIGMHSEVGYDGDGETSTSTSASSTPSVTTNLSSLYDFDEPDCDMDISPVVTNNKSKKSKKGSKSKSKASTTHGKSLAKDVVSTKATKKGKSTKNSSGEDKPEKGKSKPVTKKSSKKVDKNSSFTGKTDLPKNRGSIGDSVNNSSMFSKTPVVSLQRLDVSNVEGYESFQRQLRKRKCDTPKDKTATPQVKSKLRMLSPRQKAVSTSSCRKQKRDSGVIMSPPLHGIPVPAATDTSTPSNVVLKNKQKKNKADDSCFGFDTSVHSFLVPSMDISPVRETVPLTPLSDYASMDSLQSSFDVSRGPSADTTNDVPELFSMEEDISLNRSSRKVYKPAVTKRRQEKKKTTKSKVDDIAEKFNTEFDEIERFQLSIEEM